MSLAKYTEITNNREWTMEKADYAATASDIRCNYEEIFTRQKKGADRQHKRGKVIAWENYWSPLNQ